MTTALNGRVVDPMGNIAQDLILFNFSPEKLYLVFSRSWDKTDKEKWNSGNVKKQTSEKWRLKRIHKDIQLKVVYFLKYSLLNWNCTVSILFWIKNTQLLKRNSRVIIRMRWKAWIFCFEIYNFDQNEIYRFGLGSI